MKFNNHEKHIWAVSKKMRISAVPDKEIVWARLIQQIEMSQTEVSAHKIDRKSYWGTWLNINYRTKAILAFSFIVLILSPISYNFYHTKNLYTNAAQEKTLLLSDGTKIVLNSESKITYDRDYNKKNRSVKLVGEAYFIVKKGDLPFNIQTSHGEVSVLGTSFNVRSRDEAFEVGVNDGKVQVVSGQNKIHLSKGELIDVRSNFRVNDIGQISLDNYPDWLNQKLYCNETTLEELCSEIERTFNIQMHFLNPNIKKLTVSGLIEASDLNNVLHTMSLLTKHEFKLEGDICTIL